MEWQGAGNSGATLAQPLQVLGLPFEGELKFVNTFTGRGDIHVATDLEKGTLAADHLIDGVPCKAHKEVEFFHARGPDPEDGRVPKARIGELMRCTSSAQFQFRGNEYVADSEVTFNSFGGVERGVLAVDQDVDGHWCKTGHRGRTSGGTGDAIHSGPGGDGRRHRLPSRHGGRARAW
jgi:hypothetical protein